MDIVMRKEFEKFLLSLFSSRMAKQAIKLELAPKLQITECVPLTKLECSEVDNLWNCIPTNTPATIMPMMWGMPSRLSITGASNIIIITIRKIVTGLVTRGVLRVTSSYVRGGVSFSSARMVFCSGYFFFCAMRYSAICTALRAAPLRIWSDTAQKARELSPARS